MPWRPPSVGKKHPYDARWQRIRASVLGTEPLCRLCLSAGRTVPATVVDHIKPLQDGGTHQQDNLQPLCKRCHDAIKTPADVRARERAKSVSISVIAAAFDVRIDGTEVVDTRTFRRALAMGHGWRKAHTLSLAAIDGMIAAVLRGEIDARKLLIVTDDAQYARELAARVQAEITIQPLADDVPQGPHGSEQAWLRERYGGERDARAADVQKGNQPSRASNGK
jgi:hypothetical protein